MTTKNRKLRVGVVGCGTVGVIHAKAYQQNSFVEFVGMCDVDPERVKEQTGKLGVSGYGSIAELIEKGKPELLSVVVRWSDFEKPIEECINAGVNILSEKPISFDPAVIWRLIRLAERKGIQFGVNFNQRFTLPSRWFSRLREEGAFGDMNYTSALYNQGSCGRFEALREHMIHQFDLWRYHIGEVVSVTAQAVRHRGVKPEDLSVGVSGTMVFENGALGAFINGFDGIGGICNYYELVGSKGRGSCENFVGRAVFRPAEGAAMFKDPPWIGGGGDYWDNVPPHVNQVVEALLADRPLPVPAMAAFEAQCLCSAIIRASETGQVVKVQDVRQEILDSINH